jgi:hypothetical protein
MKNNPIIILSKISYWYNAFTMHPVYDRGFCKNSVGAEHETHPTNKAAK